MTYSYDLIVRIIKYYNNNNKSYRELENEFDISKSTIQRWVLNNGLNEPTKVEYKNRIRLLSYIKNSLNQNPFQTLDMLKVKILSKFGIIISKKTVSNYMKIIGYSKKKIVRRLYNTKLLKEHLTTRKNMKKRLKNINKEDIVCIDECAINREVYAKSGWCHKSKLLERHMKLKELPKNHSLIMAISNKKIVQYKLYKQQAINTDLYYLFLEELVKNFQNKYILMDNVSFHKSKRILELINNSNNKILFIPPYSPDFNPIEEVFSELKSFIRRHITPTTMNKDIHILLKKFSNKQINLEGYYKHAFG